MRLAEAGEGHSLDPTHWETIPQPPQHIPSSSTLSMDLPFSLRELDHALGSMHPRKAPGDDGITTALMQAIAHDPKDHGTGDVNLDRPGALALLRVANIIFLSGVIPKVWRRQIANLNSHIAFIDISKAFDTVPIHALSFKLRCIGIPTITMDFLLFLIQVLFIFNLHRILIDPIRATSAKFHKRSIVVQKNQMPPKYATAGFDA
ncbi:hypothetical protein BASA61_003793 [Batrachochytrium salamandrivorans]|nr:hypothetical protein BASA61_003793 [Batrachochytrium salamandrivorans]